MQHPISGKFSRNLLNMKKPQVVVVVVVAACGFATCFI